MALWAKVDVDMPTDAKLLGQPIATRHLWTCLICLAKKQDEEGAIRGYDCALLAGAFNVPRKAVATALTHFQSARMVELDPDGTIRLLNFIERQGVVSAAEQRDQWRQRQEKRRTVTRDSPVTQPDVTLNGHASRTEEEEEKREKEQKQDARAAAPPSPATLFQAFVKAEWPDIRKPAEFETRAMAAYPELDLLAEAKKAKGYETANPRKAKKNHGQYFWRWLGRAKQFLEANGAAANTEAVDVKRASERAARDIADTRRRNDALDLLPRTAMPESLRVMMGKIGNGK